MIRGVYSVFVLLLAVGVYAQQSCSQRLDRAEELYSVGRLLEVPELLQNCLSGDEDLNFSAAERILVHKLLTKVYIFLDNEAAAEAELVELLKVDPVHELQPEDPSELRVLMAKFRTWPIYRVEVKVGGNTNVKSVAQDFSAVSENVEEKKYNETVVLGLQVGANITRYLTKGIELGAGVQFRTTSYNVSATPSKFSFETTVTNSQTAFMLPLFLRYNFNYGNREGWLPYVFLGGSFDYFVTARYQEASRSGGTSFSLDSEDGKLKKFNQINDINYSLFGGVGIKWRVKRGNFFFGEIRFDKGLLLYNNPDERYANPVIHSDLLFVEDDIFLDFLSLNFGFIWSRYKPVKL